MRLIVAFLVVHVCQKHISAFEWPSLPKLDWRLDCYAHECCRDIHIPKNFTKLKESLKERVYGQHLVENAVHALRGHYTHGSQKALALSFHGWPGSGKNYVTKFITEAIFKYGQKSKFVHHFIGRIHFPRNDHVLQYQENLQAWLKGNVSQCPYQIFIFDEVCKMPPALLNAIKPMIDYREVVDGVDYRKSVFIFLSNTGAGLINEHYMDLWHKGIKREDLKLSDFENLITKGSFNEEGGFHRSDTISANLIDHYIPFLPMELRHVRACIIDEFRNRGVRNPEEHEIKEVLSYMEWGPDPERLFSKTGCKRIYSKVGSIVAERYPYHRKLEL